MEKNYRFEIIFALTLLLIVWLMYTPININRTCTFDSRMNTIDAAHVDVNWSAKYNAPLFIPREIKADIEGKIRYYGEKRIGAVIFLNTYSTLSQTNVSELQKLYDCNDDMIKNLIDILFPNVAEKIKNIKYIRINSFKLEKLPPKREENKTFYDYVMTQI